METNKYEARAVAIAAKIGIKVITKYVDNKCPHWTQLEGKMCSKNNNIACGECGNYHGNHYEVTICKPKQTFTFDYYNSFRDAKENKTPTVYDIICCMASDASMSTDPDDIYDEFGPMKPSQAYRIAGHATTLKLFFDHKEIAMLCEVDQ